MSKHTCEECGRSHADQIAAYPVGATVRLLADFGSVPPYDFPAGTVGEVKGHCPDGRAWIVLGGVNAGHTWHSPADFVEVIGLPQRAAESGAPCDDQALAHTIGAENAPTQPRGCNARETASGDDADFDGTPYAHPAWWRGHFHGEAGIIRAVARILDGEDAGKGVAGKDWEPIRRRLLALVADAKQADEVAAEALAENRMLAIPNETGAAPPRTVNLPAKTAGTDYPDTTELLDALAEMVNQHTLTGPQGGRYIASGGISTHADAIRLLARYGRVQILSDDGHRGVVAEWVTREVAK